MAPDLFHKMTPDLEQKMKRKVSVTLLSCDAPGCGVERISNPDLPNDPVVGVSFQVGVIDAGGWGVDGWACSIKHAPPAMFALLAEGPR